MYDNVVSGKLSPERSSVMKKLSLLFTLALATVTVTGCDAFSFINGGTTPEPEGGEVTPSKPDEGKKDPEEILIDKILLDSYSETLEIGDTYQIDYDVYPHGAYNEVSFDSSNTSVATVSVNGLVEAKAEGNAVITLTSIQDTSVTTELSITVNPAPISNYTVTFNANGGTGSMESDTTTGSTYLTPECEFTRTNYTFDGWALNSTSGTKYGVGATIVDISTNITLYATWRENTQPQTNYTVTFNANGGTGTMSAGTTTGSTYKTPACSFTYLGYTFSKWALNSASGTQYAAGSTIYGITGNITLYAIWQKNVTNYTVTFNANGGTGTMSSATTTGSTYVAPSCSFTYAGHSFKEWALNSTSGAKYNVGASITGITANITLYAIWQESSGEIDDDYGDYYASIGDGLTGTSLINALNKLNGTKRRKTMGYDGLKTWGKYTEIDWTGKDNVEGKMFGFYNNALIADHWDNQATWNREHVWPNSKGGGTVDGDMFMPRPTSVKINSDRGNMAYAASGAYDPGQFEVNYRGVAARIIFYCVIANPSLSIVDSTSIGSNQMGKLSDLLRWNLQYAPSRSANAHLTLRIEQNRNREMYRNSGLQGNRNPFVDHPEYACKIWGNTNSQTKSICGM